MTPISVNLGHISRLFTKYKIVDVQRNTSHDSTPVEYALNGKYYGADKEMCAASEKAQGTTVQVSHLVCND